MRRIVYPSNHGSNRRRSLAKARCRECHARATYGETQPRTATSISRDGRVTRYIEYVTVYWCAVHTGVAA